MKSGWGFLLLEKDFKPPKGRRRIQVEGENPSVWYLHLESSAGAAPSGIILQHRRFDTSSRLSSGDAQSHARCSSSKFNWDEAESLPG